MAGLIGASNSPISGVGILTVLGISLILAALFGRSVDADATKALVAFALFVTAIVFGVATISNDNLQDLKTGQLVGATPWRQQVALVIGVIFGALVIPPVLDLLNTRLRLPGRARRRAQRAGRAAGGADLGARPGRARRQPRLGPDRHRRADRRRRDRRRRGARASRQALRLPPLAVGMGIYLPMALTLLIPVGALIGWLYDRWADAHRQPGVRRADGRADGDRPDRRREPDRRGLRRDRRGAEKAGSADSAKSWR